MSPYTTNLKGKDTGLAASMSAVGDEICPELADD
jgi:hypothetical protein